eukprot:SAG11_NODE_3634_length_2322_cov_1.922627_3_plen_79_part_01
MLVDRFIVADKDDHLDSTALLRKNGQEGWCEADTRCEGIFAEPLRYAPHTVDGVPLPYAGAITNLYYDTVDTLLGLFFI